MNTQSQQLLNALKSSVLFKQLDTNTLEQLANSYSHLQKSYSKGSIIHNENDPCRHMDFVVTGTLDIQQIDEYGNMLTITKFSKGQSIASNTLFHPLQQYPMTICANTDVILLPLSKQDILSLSSNPVFLEAFLTDISRRASILSHTIKNITRKSLRNKLIDYLKVLYTTQGSLQVTLPITKTELANTFGVARPSLSRELTAMQKDGLLSYHRNTISLTSEFNQLYII